jgi:hypothetical protein
MEGHEKLFTTLRMSLKPVNTEELTRTHVMFITQQTTNVDVVTYVKSSHCIYKLMSSLGVGKTIEDI